MAPRASHLPNNSERSALQKLIAGRSLPASKLHPAGKQTLNGMVKKGWLKLEGQTYSITTAGQAAFKAKIPTER